MAQVTRTRYPRAFFFAVKVLNRSILSRLLYPDIPPTKQGLLPLPGITCRFFPSKHHFLRILIITPWLPNRVLPQDGNFIQYSAEVVGREHSVVLLHVAPDPELPRGQLEVVVSQASFGKQIIVYYSGRGTRVRRIWTRSRAWRAAIARISQAPDLIHGHIMVDGSIIAARLARRFGVPFVITENATRWFLPPGRKSYVVDYFLARRAARQAARILPVGEALQEALRANGFTGHFTTLPNMLQDQLFQPSTAQPTDTSRILHISNGSRQKRFDWLLPAFAAAHQQLPSLRFTIAGRLEPESQQLAEAAQAAGLPLEFLGPLSRAAVAKTMQQHDIFVLTSDAETQGLVVVEALLSGLPVVSTRCGGPEYILNDPADGQLVDQGAVAAIGHAIVSLTQQPAQHLPAARQARAARCRARFGEAAVSRRLFALYDEVVQGPSATSRN